MSTKLTSDTNPAPEGQDADRPRLEIVKRGWLSILVLGIAGLLIGAFVIFAWMVNEEHFDRPSQEFDELRAEIENLPGVEGVENERWVEAPTFADPTSWMSVTVDKAGFRGLL